jgi:hypothetical protein
MLCSQTLSERRRMRHAISNRSAQAQAPPRRNGRPACPMSSTPSDPPARQPHAPRLSANARPDLGTRPPSAQDLSDRTLDHSRPPLRHLSEPRRSDRMPGPAFPRHRPLPAVPPAFVRTAPERPPPDRPGRVCPAAAPPVPAAFVRRVPAPPFPGQPRQHPSARVSSDAANIHPHAPSAVTGHPNGICPNRAGGAGQPDRPVRSRARAQRLGRRTARRRPPPSRRDLPPLPVSRLGPG